LFNSLSQTLLKITTPGVPDFYQGAELWDLSLVDPDNRRPVDYKMRRDLLDDLKLRLEKGPRVELIQHLLRGPENGQVKMFVVHMALQVRRKFRELFEKGNYAPVSAIGPRRDHIFAFEVAFQNQSVVVVVPRLVCTLAGGNPEPPTGAELWKDTVIDLPAATQWHNAFTDEELATEDRQGRGAFPVSKLFAAFPVALLHR
jgi:(1->4)-alpha-D-glucan 1-alpha-D-glucosylmutase